MPATVVVIYPHTEGTSKFDMKYYLDTHMPLVQDTWGPTGLKKWSVTKLDESAGYSVQAILHFDSAKDIQASMSDDAKRNKVMGDVPNFTNEKPIIVAGEQVGSS